MPVKNKWYDVMDCFIIYCGGYHYVSWKSIEFGCYGYLFKWESMKCSMPQSGIYFALTSRYSIAIHIPATWSCLFYIVPLMVNFSQINWLSCQISGISKQALDFVRDGKVSRPRWNLAKSVTFWEHPLLKMVWSKTFCALEIFEEPNSL